MLLLLSAWILCIICKWHYVSFKQRGAEVKLVPFNHDISEEEFDGLFISNGPGDPMMAEAAINNVKKVR